MPVFRDISLLALVVRLGVVEKSASVLHGDSVSSLGLVGAIALLQNLLCNTHYELGLE